MNQSLLDALLWNGEGEPPQRPVCLCSCGDEHFHKAPGYQPCPAVQFDQIIAARKREAEVRKNGADVLLNVCRSHYQHVRDPNAHGGKEP